MWLKQKIKFYIFMNFYSASIFCFAFILFINGIYYLILNWSFIVSYKKRNLNT